MSWETRPNGRRYYTRTCRVNGKVVRMYVGGGGSGNAAAVIDCARRQLLHCERRRRAIAINEIREFESDLLLVERVAIGWLAVQADEYRLAACQPEYRTHWQRQVDHANQRFLASLRLLTAVRRIPRPAVQVNIGEQQVNVSG
jgi:hypothetical protein